MSNVIPINNVESQNIEVTNQESQQISISQKQSQKVTITNSQQQVDVSTRPPQRIGITNSQVIKIGGDGSVSSVNGKVGDVVIDYNDVGAVPVKLSVLPQVQTERLNTMAKRQDARLYIQINNTASTVSVEQIKQLNTKILTVDSLTDERIHTLSIEDYIYLRKEK